MEQYKHDYRRTAGYEASLDAELQKQAGAGMEMIRVRVMAPTLPEDERRQLTTTVELMLEDFGWQPVGAAQEYPCRSNPKVTRIYVNGKRARKEERHE